MKIESEKRITLVFEGDIEIQALNHIAEWACNCVADKTHSLTASGKCAQKLAQEIAQATRKPWLKL